MLDRQENDAGMPPARRMNLRETIGPVVLVALLSCIGTLGGAYFTLKGDEGQKDADIVQATYQRMKSLEAQVSSMQSQIIKQNAEIVNLKVQLNNKVSVNSMLDDLLDGIPFPAWIKRVEYNSDTGATQFRMVLINKQYEYQFGISKYRYESALDSEVWPEKIADEFKSHDDQVLSMRSPKITVERFPKNPDEPVSKDNPLVNRRVTKMFLQFDNQDPLIFGMLMPRSDSN